MEQRIHPDNVAGHRQWHLRDSRCNRAVSRERWNHIVALDSGRPDILVGLSHQSGVWVHAATFWRLAFLCDV
jgi:hypothetical protein